MGGYDTDVSGTDFDYLHLAWGSAWESDDFGPEAAEARWVVCGFERGDFFGRGGEGVEGDGVVEGDEDLGAGEAGLEDLGGEFEGYGCELFGVVPDDELG